MASRSTTSLSSTSSNPPLGADWSTRRAASKGAAFFLRSLGPQWSQGREGPAWTARVSLAPRLVTDILILLGQKRHAYLGIHEQKQSGHDGFRTSQRHAFHGASMYHRKCRHSLKIPRNSAD